MLLLAGVTGCIHPGGGSPPIPPEMDAEQSIVWEHPYPNLTVEVDYVHELETRGRAPSQAALGFARQTLQEVTAKRSIEVVGPDPIDLPYRGPTQNRTMEEIHELHAASLDTAEVDEPGNDGSFTLHVLYVNGNRAEGSVAGYSQGEYVVLFPDAYDVTPRFSTRQPEIIHSERAVLVHEIGHSMGLVDMGAPETEERTYGCCHSQNPESVMHPGIHRQEGLAEYFREDEYPPFRFDEHDKADLAALRALEPDR